jgi:hypothetical protein
MTDEPNFKVWPHDRLVDFAENAYRNLIALSLALEEVRLKLKAAEELNRRLQDDWK